MTNATPEMMHSETTMVVRTKSNVRLMNDFNRQRELFKQFGVSEGLLWRCAILPNKDGGWSLITRKEEHADASPTNSRSANAVAAFTYAGRYSCSGCGREEDRLESSCSVELDEVRAFSSPF